MDEEPAPRRLPDRDPPGWREKAACRGMNNDEFIDTIGRRRKNEEWGTARSACESCPVTQQCLDDAPGNYWDFRGGLTPLEQVMRDHPGHYADRPPERQRVLYRKLLERKRPYAGSFVMPDGERSVVTVARRGEPRRS